RGRRARRPAPARVPPAGGVGVTDVFTAPLMPLPAQPDGVPWPTGQWAEAPVPDGVGLEPLVDEAFDDTGPLAVTYAVVVIHGGRLVAERYGGEPEQWDGPHQ